MGLVQCCQAVPPVSNGVPAVTASVAGTKSAPAVTASVTGTKSATGGWHLPSAGGMVATPYGTGMLLEDPGKMAKVKLPFGMAFIHANQVAPLKKVATPYGSGRVIDEKNCRYSVQLPFGVAHIIPKHCEPLDELIPDENVDPRLQLIAEEYATRLCKLLSEKQQLMSLALATSAGAPKASAIEGKPEITRKKTAEAKTSNLPKKVKTDMSQLDEDEIGLLASACHWSILPFNVVSKVKGTKAWQIEVKTISTKKHQWSSKSGLQGLTQSSTFEEVNAKSLSDGKQLGSPFIDAVIVDNTGQILGRSARTEPGALIHKPLYIICGPEQEPRFLFLGLKQYKAKKGTLKASEMGFAFLNLQECEKDKETEIKIQMYKKPINYTRDPKRLQTMGGTMSIQLRLLS